MPRSFTARLLLQFNKYGADIVCAMAPFEGKPVVYRPRHTRDNAPWVLASQADTEHSKHAFRYSGDECKSVPGESGVTDCGCCGTHIMVNNIRRESYCDECPEACDADHDYGDEENEVCDECGCSQNEFTPGCECASPGCPANCYSPN